MQVLDPPYNGDLPLIGTLVRSTEPGSCCLPMPGIRPKILREDGAEAGPNEGGRGGIGYVAESLLPRSRR